jgi:rare lipoprotein A
MHRLDWIRQVESWRPHTERRGSWKVSAKSSRHDLALAALPGLALILVFFSSGCLHHHRRTATTARQAPSPAANRPSRPTRTGAKTAAAPAPIIQGEEGIASWYGRPYHGRKTASGEIYNMYGISAAHRTLPFGTRVRVHDLDNGKEVEASINDRGPFIEGRIIDLSYGAAKVIHLDIDGVARVKLEILGYGYADSTVPPPGIFAVQVGAFRDSENAERLKARIETHYAPVIIQSFDRGDGLFHRVRVGHESTEAAAQELARRLREDKFADQTFVIRLN